MVQSATRDTPPFSTKTDTYESPKIEPTPRRSRAFFSPQVKRVPTASSLLGFDFEALAARRAKAPGGAGAGAGVDGQKVAEEGEEYLWWFGVRWFLGPRLRQLLNFRYPLGGGWWFGFRLEALNSPPPNHHFPSHQLEGS